MDKNLLETMKLTGTYLLLVVQTLGEKKSPLTNLMILKQSGISRCCVDLLFPRSEVDGECADL